jgi:hypothetical protein
MLLTAATGAAGPPTRTVPERVHGDEIGLDGEVERVSGPREAHLTHGLALDAATAFDALTVAAAAGRFDVVSKLVEELAARRARAGRTR